MPWVKIKTEFHYSPKAVQLAELMGWTEYHARGFLCHFWDWCLHHCDSGDLSNMTSTTLGRCFGLNEADSAKLLDSMVIAGWIDNEPYLRVHDWWDHQKEYLKAKYYKNQMWQEIEKAYCTGDRPFQKPAGNSCLKVPPEATRLAKLLFELIKANNPHSIAEEKHIPAWADAIRLLNEKDNQPYEVIEQVINWCQKDSFWKSNILSGAKLRLQWDKLTVRMKGDKNGRQVKAGTDKYSGI